MAYTHTIFPGYIPSGYFDDSNVQFVQKKIQKVLGLNFTQKVDIPAGDVVKVMLRILSQKLEEIPKMNERVVMQIVGEFRNHQIDVEKRLWWTQDSRTSTALIDGAEGLARYDPGSIKLANRFSSPLVGGTTRFYFT